MARSSERPEDPAGCRTDRGTTPQTETGGEGGSVEVAARSAPARCRRSPRCSTPKGDAVAPIDHRGAAGSTRFGTRWGGAARLERNIVGEPVLEWSKHHRATRTGPPAQAAGGAHGGDDREGPWRGSVRAGWSSSPGPGGASGGVTPSS